MKPNTKLSTSMTVTQFEHGYWYATELKKFAQMIRTASASKLRKDELEKAIKVFLETGKIASPTARSLSTPGPCTFSAWRRHKPSIRRKRKKRSIGRYRLG